MMAQQMKRNMLNKLYTSIFVQKLFDSGTF